MPIALIAACVLGVAGIVTVIHLVWGDKAPPPVKVSAPPPPSPPPVQKQVARTPTALERARLYRESNPTDYAGQTKLYWEAVWQTEGTPLFETARQELQEALANQKRVIGQKLTELEWRVLELRKEERFYLAKKTLANARTQMNDADGEAAIEQMSTDLDEEIEALYSMVKLDAMEAKRHGQKETSQKICDRVNQWGLAEKSLDLMNSLTNQR